MRAGRGFYRSLVAETVAACQAAGAYLYNDAVLVTPAGSLPLRTARAFPAGRKLGKSHQNLLVFYKGDPRLIKQHFPPADLICDDRP